MTSDVAAPATAGARGGSIARATAGLVPFAPTILRVLIGFIFLVYGYNKLPDPAGFEQFVASLGIPAPQVMAPFIIGLELIGGALLILGLLVRPVALLLAIEMVVTILTVKLDLGIAPRGNPGLELDLALFAGAVVLVILGAGRASVDQDVLRRELI